MFFRAYYAIPGGLRTSYGLPTNAIFGFTTMFRKLFSGRSPDKGAVVFDAPGPTFRKSKYPEYKANRERPPDELTQQRPFVDEVVQAYGFPILRVPGYEADDVIGTLVQRAKSTMDVLIVSADKDFMQLLGPSVKMFDPFTGAGVTYDAELAQKKWGIPPNRFIDFLALMGDKIDNIPGVPGIGKKGASELIEKYGHLEGILENIEELKGRQRSALETHRDNARLSKELARIDTRVPLPVALDDLTLPPLNESSLNELYIKLEFFSLLTEAKASEAEEAASQDSVSLATEDDLAVWLREQAAVVAIEPIWDSPAVSHTSLVGLAMSREPGRSIYVDLREGIPPVLATWLREVSTKKLAHEAKLLYVMFAACGVELAGLDHDLQLASFLVDPNRLIPHRLDQIAREYLQRPLPPAKRVIGSGKKEKRFRDIEPEAIMGWAGRRAVTIFEAWPKVWKDVTKEGQSKHFDQIDLPLSRVLAKMESTGIGVDGQELAHVEAEFQAKLDDLEQEAFRLAGGRFNLRSPKQLSKVLFEDLALPVIKKTKTGFSTDAEVLERLTAHHPIAEVLLEQRKFEKLINTYTRVLREAISEETGRVHATFQQTVGVTGRLISTDPDLQRTPIKTSEGERIRRAFVSRPGMRIVSADWSQIELRVLAHVSQDPLLEESFREEQDVHSRTASELFRVPIAKVSKEQRRVGKTVNFATVYGQGATALSQNLRIPRKEAQSYIDGYFQAYAGVRTWLDRTIAGAKATGYVETLFGRRRYIPELSSNDFVKRAAGERIAANTPIQGSAADICKAAMLAIAAELHQAGLRTEMVLQVHDELVFECPESEVEQTAEIARRHMESQTLLLPQGGRLSFGVPLVCEVGVGQTWAEAH